MAGEDAYRCLLKRNLKTRRFIPDDGAHYGGRDIVPRGTFQTFGYYVTESSNHVRLYSLFRKKAETIEGDINWIWVPNIRAMSKSAGTDKEKDAKLNRKLATKL